MSERRDRDRLEAEAELARSRQELAGAIDALRARLNPDALLREATSGLRGALPGGGGKAQGLADGFRSGLRAAGLQSALPVVNAAGSVIRANPVAATLAGAGVAWLAWSTLRRAGSSRREAQPEWLVAVSALREEADRLRGRVERALEDGHLDETAARDSLDEIDASVESETRRLMGQGLDSLDVETRAAALEARQAVWEREFDRGGGLRVGKMLATGTALASVGGLLASYFSHRTSPAEKAMREAEAAAEQATAAARELLTAEAARLKALASELGQSLREVMEELEAEAKETTKR